ncbi:MAG: divergent polysaccharide deacetylase family protein [Deltaproteobacteria bacterium]|nr:divergent polysaccharide deacetylase family protein [Deltaproteobacteria bacterium]
MSKGGSRRIILFGIIAVIAVLVTTVFFLEKRLSHKDVPFVRTKITASPTQSEILVIKGCLFDLGIDTRNTSISGQTIKVKAREELSQNRLRYAFAPLKKTGNVEVIDNSTVKIVINGKQWDIIFVFPPQKVARLAIIIDDMGLNMKPAKQLGEIDADLTFSILPMRPYSKETAKYLHAKGREILLHLPMEGNGKNPGSGAIQMGMSPAEVRAILFNDIRSIPYIDGVNNHMGSKVTQDRAIMSIVLKDLKRQNLFYIDSLTTSDSVCREIAADIGLSFNKRDVFLDNERSQVYIAGQLEKLIAIAQKYQQAIGICHPHPETIAVLERELPKIQGRGVSIERVSRFVKNSN